MFLLSFLIKTMCKQYLEVAKKSRTGMERAIESPYIKEIERIKLIREVEKINILIKILETSQTIQ